MEWIELNDMEYGECVVLGGGDKTVLMVDCGSMSLKTRDGDVPMETRYEEVASRYDGAMDRFFLLTHYHRDHISGFQKLLDTRPGYFSRVFLPCAPTDSREVPLLLEFALFAHLFSLPQTDSFQVNTACVKIFRTLSDKLGADRIFTVGAGDIFRFDGVDYQVLWPKTEGYPFEPELAAACEELNVLFSSPFQPDCVKQFLELKENFLQSYVNCCEAFRASRREIPEKRRAILERLNDTLDGLEKLKDDLNLSPAAHQTREVLENPVYAQAYSNGVNAASVVFQNVRTKEAGFEDILMTGDATPETMLELTDQLYDGYFILKAPHHGTASGYSDLFTDMSAAHILISNGEYHAGGAVAQEYIDRPDSIRHCANPNACKWFQAAGACCNRLNACYDQESGFGLAIKCAAAAGQAKKDGGCHIRVTGSHGVRACFCDVNRSQ